MPLYANAKTQSESTKQANDLSNRPTNLVSISPESPNAGSEAARVERMMSEAAELGLDRHQALEEARMSAVFAKHLIMRNVSDSLVAQARLLDSKSLRLLD
jgi:hypothetical protein